MIDYDKFTIHPEIEGGLVVYSITEKQMETSKLQKKKIH